MEKLKQKALEFQTTIRDKKFVCNSDVGYCKSCHEYYKAINDQAEHVQTDFRRKREVFFLPYT
jgi:hypothetical protein